MKIVAVVSGGMDSVTALIMARSMVSDGLVISFDYGQRHRREVEMASLQALLYCGWPHQVIDLRSITPSLIGSSLTDASVETPHGHYSEESMRRTVVPGRNAMMLSVAWGIAAAQGADGLLCGVHAGDHYIYPDCRPGFVRALEKALKLGTVGHASEHLHLWAPFLAMTKAEILRLGHRLGVDYSRTWTCYEGGELACGKCGACRERLEAFATIGETDPLEYSP